MLPVLKDNKDPHYRYKMPKLTAKIEGSGNGIKTVITNISSVSRSLGRPPSYPLKYFGTELGANVKMDAQADLYVMNGAHDPEKLLELLYKFIEKFVLCNKCKNPETRISVERKEIYQRCIACGHEATIPKVHNLTKFILKDHMESKGSSKGKQSKSKQSSPTSNANDSGFDMKSSKADDEGDDGFDDEELTAAAYAERMRELCKGLSNDVYLSDPVESANAFYEIVKEKIESGHLYESEVQKELVKEAERLNIKNKATLIISELIFSENMIEEISKNRLLLLRFCNENLKAQKNLLSGFEKLVGNVYKEQLIGKTMLILKAFYDEDILDEEAILEWAKKVSKKNVPKAVSQEIHDKAAPFIKWLQEAEEESDESSAEEDSSESIQKSEEDEDDGVELDLEFSHRVDGLQITSSSDKSNINGSTPKNQVIDVVDDINIDDI